MNKYKLLKAGIDARQGILRLNDSEELYELMLNRFPEDTHFEGLRNAIEKKDVKEAFENAHALKGLAGNLSLIKLYSALVPLVEKLRKDSLENADTLFKPVFTAYNEIIEAVKQ